MIYDIIKTSSKDDMIIKINDKLRHGWICVGGVSVLHSPGTYLKSDFYQTIIQNDVKADTGFR